MPPRPDITEIQELTEKAESLKDELERIQILTSDLGTTVDKYTKAKASTGDVTNLTGVPENVALIKNGNDRLKEAVEKIVETLRDSHFQTPNDIGESIIQPNGEETFDPASVSSLKQYITPEAHDSKRLNEIVVINTNLHPRLSCHRTTSSDLKEAVWRAIRMVVPNLMKESINVAFQSTRSHILMAYPLGTSRKLIKDASYMMVTSLAKKYVRKMCKESLRGWMYELLHDSLQLRAIQYHSRCMIVDSIISDNLEPICGVIQNMATTKVAEVFEAEFSCWIFLSSNEKSLETVKESLKGDISGTELKDLLDSLFGTVGEKYEALLEAIFMGVENGFADVLREKKGYFKAVMEPMSEYFFLLAVRNYFVKRASVSFGGKVPISFKKEVAAVFKRLPNDTSLVSALDVTSIFDNNMVAHTSMRQSVKDLVKRLEGTTPVQDRVAWIV